MRASDYSEQPLLLPQVSLCAVTSVNLRATIRALETCLAAATFADCLLFTDVPLVDVHPRIRVVPIPRLPSSAAYSQFMLTQLVDYVTTTHCLVVQWDGHVLDARRWRPEFLDYDYIGASWPQFDDGHDVGNGGFSLRSRRLMEACRNSAFIHIHPEDLAIGRINRAWLEEQGLRFAPRALADLFSAERAGEPELSFGFHGVFLMPSLLSHQEFWHVYCSLDERKSVWRDFWRIAYKVVKGRWGVLRATKILGDRLLSKFAR